MIRLWAEVYDGSYTTQVENGYVELVSANVDRVLDGPGMVDVVTAPLHRDFSKRPIDLLTNKRVCEVWYQEEERTKRKVATFVIEKVSFVDEAGGVRMQVQGPDTLSLLLNYTTGLGLSYDDRTIAYIVNQLTGLAGWTASLGAGVLASSRKATVRFDGTSILKALKNFALQMGYHFRLTDTFKEIEFGALGADSGYRVVHMEGDKQGAYRADGVIPMETIDLREDSSELVNSIIPLSSGDGDSRGDLGPSTRTTPYPIQTESINSRDHYLLEDSASIATYGTIRKVLNFSKIAPIGTSDTSRERTANYLYDGASEWLTRHKDVITEITARVFQPRVSVGVGDKVLLEYLKQVNAAGTPVTLKDIKADYWVMSLTERYGEGGEEGRMELVSIDRSPFSQGDSLVQGLDAIDVQETGYKPTYNIFAQGPFQDWCSAFQLPDFELSIPADVLRVENVTMVVHTYVNRQETITATPFVFGPHNFEDQASGYPYDMTLQVNGTTVVSGLGDDSDDQIVGDEFDITDEVLALGSDGRGDHTIALTSVAGSGLLRIQFLIRGLIVQGKVT